VKPRETNPFKARSLRLEGTSSHSSARLGWASAPRQGEPGKRFYLIASGEVEIHIDGAFRHRNGTGECFGEIALLNDVPRTATVKALPGCRLLALERRHFVSAVTGHLRSDEAATTVADERLALLG
jgi:CRP-like cAMP-binding protein